MTSGPNSDWRTTVFGDRDEQPQSLLVDTGTDDAGLDDVAGYDVLPNDAAAAPQTLYGPRDPRPSRTPSSPPSRRLKALRRTGPGQSSTDSENRKPRLVEWHTLTPAERAREWAGLLAWVTWLHDRFELSIETRLPRCWVQHPGLIEELWALKAWREEIYNSTEPNGQMARYWHTEMRQMIESTNSFYARGCRSGHKGATVLASTATELQAAWAQGDPMAGIPATLIIANQAVVAPEETLFLANDTMDELLASKAAVYTSDTMHDNVKHDGSWWYVDPAKPGGWTRNTDPRYAEMIDIRAAKMAKIDAQFAHHRAGHGAITPSASSHTPAPGTTPAGD